MSTPDSPSPSKVQAPSSPAPKRTGDRIAKVLARRGVASRREVERMIEEGRVRLNGTLLTTPAVVVSARDAIEVDGKPLPAREPVRVWRYHKVPGLVVSHNDERNRQSVFDAMPKDMPRVISVGRLDLNSEGLMLMTNDGELARTLELPATGWSRHYRARAYGRVDQSQLDTLKKGIEIEGRMSGPIEALLERKNGDNVWVGVTLREGKNREVRRALEHVGLKVNRLIRTSYGPFQLGNLERGMVEEVKPRILADQIGHLVEVKIPPAPRKPRAKGDRGAPKSRSYPPRPPTRSEQGHINTKGKRMENSGSQNGAKGGAGGGKGPAKGPGKGLGKGLGKAAGKAAGKGAGKPFVKPGGRPNGIPGGRPGGGRPGADAGRGKPGSKKLGGGRSRGGGR